MERQKVIEELEYKTSRSSGPGGQHANKTESRVTVVFDLTHSLAFTPEEKERLLTFFQSQLTQEGVLQFSCEESRSQHRNKQLVTQRLLRALEKAIIPPKTRKKTKISKQAHKKRLEKKKRQAQKKLQRKKPEI